MIAAALLPSLLEMVFSISMTLLLPFALTSLMYIALLIMCRIHIILLLKIPILKMQRCTCLMSHWMLIEILPLGVSSVAL